METETQNLSPFQKLINAGMADMDDITGEPIMIGTKIYKISVPIGKSLCFCSQDKSALFEKCKEVYGEIPFSIEEKICTKEDQISLIEAHNNVNENFDLLQQYQLYQQGSFEISKIIMNDIKNDNLQMLDIYKKLDLLYDDFISFAKKYI